MEKYYDLIVSLIKSNRRYPGCEDILDSIFDDVYAHANVVLNTVSNESVVTSYLTKIVTTSMITVPKRLGVVHKKQETIEFPETEMQEIIPSEETVDVQETSLETEAETELDPVEDTLELLGEEDNIEESLDEINQYDEDEEIVEENEEQPEVEADEFIEEEEEEEEEEIAPVVDKTLVDRMINGVPQEENISEIEKFEEEEEEEETGEISDITEDTIEENLLTTEDAEELPLELAEEADLEPVIEEAASLEDFDIDEAAESPNEEIYESDEEEISEPVESEEEVIDEDNAVDSEYECPSFKDLAFTPNKEDIDFSEILPEIDALDSKHPDLNILEIFNLKYKQRMSINDIAKDLNIEETDILKALNELMYLVKE
jgi:hypothetical protein